MTWRRGSHEVQCIALDINAHGMFLSTHVLVEHGALMRIAVLLPDGPLEMFVTARYVGRTMRGQGIGCELFLLDEAGRERWAAYYRGELERALTAAAVAATPANDAEPLRLAV